MQPKHVGIMAGLFSAALACACFASGRTGQTGASLALLPGSAVIDGSYGYQTLAVIRTAPDGSQLDVTSQAALSSSAPGVLKISGRTALPVSDGQAEVTAVFGGQSARARLTVRNAKTDAGLTFNNDITPIFIKHGCNGAACHGGPNGQGGLKLSLFGYDAKDDREAIWSGDKGRRINAADPANSMFLLKPMGVIPHGGGKKFSRESREYATILAWIRAGGPVGPKAAASSGSGLRLASTSAAAPPAVPTLESLTLLPADRTVRVGGSRHQLIVMARYSDGTQKDVTALSRFASDDEGIVSASSTGSLSVLRHGEANVMVRFGGKASVSRFYALIRPAPAGWPRLTENNFVDTHVFSKLKKMGILPSPLSDDYSFIRRVSLDIAGVMPTPNAVRSFVESRDPNKRARLIDELLERPEYQDVMTIQWSELLRINRLFLQEQGVRQYTAFVREAFADNKPFDQFVRELIGSVQYPRDVVEKSRDAQSRADQAAYRQASGHYNGPINYYRVTADPTELTTSTTQIFLGVRMDCARCHNHPFDRWTMRDFYGFAAYFAGTGHVNGKARDELAVYIDKNSQMRIPKNNELANPKPLTETEGRPDTEGRRHKLLAEWMTSKDNPFFAKATVNRFWKHFFGRGIVHPVDDLRATNPPVNEPLLEALAKDFVDHNYDIKHLIRTICSSRTYQLSNETNESNETDTKNFSHYYSKRLGPEVLFDAIVSATGVPESFGGAVARRATNLPDNNVGSYFLDVFGRSRRLQVQERSDQTSMSQALHLMNGGTINDRIAHPQGRVAKILKTQLSAEETLEEIYLSTLCRKPTAKEKEAAAVYMKGAASPREAYEDLMWAILNSREFIFNH
jgi:hypothetical protein